ncbi:cadherin-related family member 1-like [Magallana gigas]|uniref:cadherin-related family member 1-like n=1 Tax=Magallana gigas TaxID=29159 RepID=UPI0033415181
MADDIYSDYFDINEHSGVVVLKKELDYEKLTSLHYTIIAKDGGSDNQTHCSTAELLIRVENLQDEPPIFFGLPYVKHVPEYFFGLLWQTGSETVFGPMHKSSPLTRLRS